MRGDFKAIIIGVFGVSELSGRVPDRVGGERMATAPAPKKSS